jgi:hypothetical protein
MRFVAVAAAIFGLWFVAREVRTAAPPSSTAVRRADLTALTQQVARIAAVERAADDRPIDEVEIDEVDEIDEVEPYEQPAPSEPPLDLSGYEAYGEVITIVGNAPIIDTTSVVSCGGGVMVREVEYLEPIPLPEPSDEPAD